MTGENSSLSKGQTIGFLPAGVIVVANRSGGREFCAGSFFLKLGGFRGFRVSHLECLAATTGLEPATSAVTVLNSEVFQ